MPRHASDLRSLLLAVLMVVTACGAEGGGGDIDPAKVIRVNDASEEVLLTMADQVANGQLIIDDTLAAQLVTPEPGVAVNGGEPVQFAWSVPSLRNPRHGTTTGVFVWLRLTGGGLAEPIDVIAVDVTNWTPDAATWSLIAATSGPVTVTLTNAFVDGGIVMEGPYRGSTAPTFSILSR
jgi:hypothetical protein